jgi:hypothetical protein
MRITRVVQLVRCARNCWPRKALVNKFAYGCSLIGEGGVQPTHCYRTSYLSEKRAAFEQWECYLDKLK